ncbi:MAG: serine/threonine-protein kinase [Nitrospirota bacterium]
MWAHSSKRGEQGEREEQPKPKYARWNLEPGASIADGRWVVKRLGGGSRYEVYLVWDERLFALMVAKILRPDQAEDARALDELRREAEVLERLAHPVLVRSFGTVVAGSYPHILLEHIEGPTLDRLINRHGQLPLEQLLPLALHMAAVLHYLSVEGFVHLDVKPGNIMMGIPPRLIDLSIARSAESAKLLRAPIGTDAYMAPEQCDPKSFVGCMGTATDMWGLGATLYHAATGRRPFVRAPAARDNTDPGVRFPQLVDAPGPFPKGIPAPLGDLILRMLDRNPAARPAPAELPLVLEPLVAGLSGGIRVSKLGIHARSSTSKWIDAVVAPSER